VMGKRVLVIGYGNPGRADDGLGPALATALEALRIPGLTVESDYQLSIEHAAMAAEHDIVVFADADPLADGPFSLRRGEGSLPTAWPRARYCIWRAPASTPRRKAICWGCGPRFSTDSGKG
jgi:hypothetical protein